MSDILYIFLCSESTLYSRPLKNCAHKRSTMILYQFYALIILCLCSEGKYNVRKLLFIVWICPMIPWRWPLQEIVVDWLVLLSRFLGILAALERSTYWESVLYCRLKAVTYALINTWLIIPVATDWVAWKSANKVSLENFVK